MHKDIRQLWRRAKAQGWTAELCGSGHERWTAPAGGHVTISVTCNGGRTYQNTLALLKKAGLKDGK